uniref:Juvenile hormone diol kinase n=1 Tax=Heortia vitessoides TaxID=1557813 RepID=A0A5J6CXQ7_9NEOP|nr:juvenile hormone diol kinase [Heortia vitessoides]
MVSDFRKKKLQHVFTVFFDTNKSGNIDKKDFDLAVEKVAGIRGWKAGEAPYKVLQDTLNALWEGIQTADANKDGEVTFDEWVSAWDTIDKEWQILYAKFIFQLEDASSDGSIDSGEFSTVYASFGIDKAEAVAAFQKMANGKANVSWPEFEQLFKEYFTSEDVNAPGNFIFGKTSF